MGAQGALAMIAALAIVVIAIEQRLVIEFLEQAKDRLVATAS